MTLEGLSPDELLGLARDAMLAHLEPRPCNHRMIQSMDDLDLAGIFVTVRKRSENRIMASVGRLGPSQDPLGQVLAETAVAAVANDYRLEPITTASLKEIQIEIALLYDRTEVGDPTQLDPERCGIVVETGSKRAVLLPNDQETPTPAAQLAKARKKAGITPDEKIRIAKFSVTRFSD